MSRYIIIVSGPQGSGKTTQAERVAERYNFPLFEAGVELREFAEGDTKEAAEVRSYMEKGELVPHHLVGQLLIHYIAKHPITRGVVFDGFPRSLEQWPLVAKLADQNQADVIGVYITLNDETALKRIAKRVEVHNGVAEKRDDDTPEGVKHRLAVYREETVPVLEHIKDSHQLLSIDGSPGIDEVSAAIFTKLDPIVNAAR